MSMWNGVYELGEEEVLPCSYCGEQFRMVYIGFDPPEPYGDVCGCPDENLADARTEKASTDAGALLALQAQQDTSEDE